MELVLPYAGFVALLIAFAVGIRRAQSDAAPLQEALRDERQRTARLAQQVDELQAVIARQNAEVARYAERETTRAEAAASDPEQRMFVAENEALLAMARNGQPQDVRMPRAPVTSPAHEPTGFEGD